MEPVAPLSGLGLERPWEGRLKRRAQDYRVTATLAHLECPDALRACIEVLRCQDERPWLCVVDTGSSKRVVQELLDLEADCDDLEIHLLRARGGYTHSSQSVAVACDLAWSHCETEFLFMTHMDCFLRRRDYISYLLSMCSPESPAVGYEMSPRSHETEEWRGMISHTASLFHTNTIRNTGASWSIERSLSQFRYKRVVAGWPDTETGFNKILREHKIDVRLIGKETNYERQITEDFDHVRSYISRYLYSTSEEMVKIQIPALEDAIREANARVRLWGGAPTKAPCLSLPEIPGIQGLEISIRGIGEDGTQHGNTQTIRFGRTR